MGPFVIAATFIWLSVSSPLNRPCEKEAGGQFEAKCIVALQHDTPKPTPLDSSSFLFVDCRAKRCTVSVMDYNLYSSRGRFTAAFKGVSTPRAQRSADVCRSRYKSGSLCLCQLDIDEEEGEQCAAAAAADRFSVK